MIKTIKRLPFYQIQLAGSVGLIGWSLVMMVDTRWQGWRVLAGVTKTNTTIKWGRGGPNWFLDHLGRRWLDGLTAQQGEEGFGWLDSSTGGTGGGGGWTGWLVNGGQMELEGLMAQQGKEGVVAWWQANAVNETTCRCNQRTDTASGTMRRPTDTPTNLTALFSDPIGQFRRSKWLDLRNDGSWQGGEGWGSGGCKVNTTIKTRGEGWQMDSHFGWSYLPRQNPGRISKKKLGTLPS